MSETTNISAKKNNVYNNVMIVLSINYSFFYKVTYTNSYRICMQNKSNNTAEYFLDLFHRFKTTNFDKKKSQKC